MWRDRTNLFMSYRQSFSRYPAENGKENFTFSRFGGPNTIRSSNGEERRGLISGDSQDLHDQYSDSRSGRLGRNFTGDHIIIEMDELLPPRWHDVQDEVTRNIKSIECDIRRLDVLHQKHVLPNFDDESVQLQEERDIEKLTQQITHQFHECQRALQKIDTIIQREGSNGEKIRRGDYIMAQNLKIALASRIGQVSTSFRKKQSIYMKKLCRANEKHSTTCSDESDEPSVNFIDQSKLLAHNRRTTEGTRNAAQREREINDISNSIIDLANIFQDLQTLVIDQGSMLDRIDYNVERLAVDVKSGAVELTLASKTQRRSIKRKILLFLLLLIFAALVLLSLKLAHRSMFVNTS